MDRRIMRPRQWRPTRVVSMIGCVAAVLVASSCVLDISEDVGRAHVDAINDRGVMLARDGAETFKVGPDRVRTVLTSPGAVGWSGEFLNNDGVVAGTAILPDETGSPAREIPMVWDANSEPIDLRRYLVNGEHPWFTVTIHALTNTGKLLGREAYYHLKAAETEWRAFVWDVATRKTSYLPVTSALTVTAMNDRGVIVISRKLGGASHAGIPVRYASPQSPAERFPGLNGSTTAEVVAFNNNGRAIGHAVGEDGVGRVFSWS